MGLERATASTGARGQRRELRPQLLRGGAGGLAFLQLDSVLATTYEGKSNRGKAASAGACPALDQLNRAPSAGHCAATASEKLVKQERG